MYKAVINLFNSVQFSCSVLSYSLQHHERQNARPPCPSPIPVTQTHVYWVSDAIQPSHPLSSPSPPTLNLSQHQGLFKLKSALCIRWPKCWSFSFNISPSSEYSELISFRMDWFDLLAVQGLSRVFSNTIVQKHQFFSAQLSLSSNSHVHTLHIICKDILCDNNNIEESRKTELCRCMDVVCYWN